MAFRIWVIKTSNTYISDVRERCWENLFILANKLTTLQICMYDGTALVLVTNAVQVLVQNLKPEIQPKQFDHNCLDSALCIWQK